MTDKKSNDAVENVSQATSAADRIVEALENRIYSGELSDGQMLPAEREIIDEFTVSRTVAREAIKILGGKGLVDSVPRHRPVVRAPDYDTVTGMLGGLVKHLMGRPGGVRQIFDIRIFTESGLVRMAALEATKTDIRNLRDALARNEECVEDSDAFYDTDMAFHAVLYTIPGNPIFPAIHRSFCDWLDWHWRQMPRLPDRNERNYLAHKAILDNILNRDPEGAETALRTHLDDAWTQVVNTFKDLK